MATQLSFLFRFGCGELHVLKARCAVPGVSKPVVQGVVRTPVVLEARCADVVRTPVMLMARYASVVRTPVVLHARCGERDRLLGVV